MFKFLDRWKSKPPPEEEDRDDEFDDLNEKLAALESAKNKLDDLQMKLEGVAKDSRDRQKASQEATDDLKKTMSQRFAPELMRRLREAEEDEHDRPTAPAFARDKLPSGAG